MSTFRDDGAAALDWVASYLERLRDYPVLARVEPGVKARPHEKIHGSACRRRSS